MTWTPISPNDAHRQAFRGHDVVGVLRSHIPFVAESATLEVASSRPLTVLEEFTMRAVLEIDGLQDAGDVSDLLGLGQPSFVAPIVSRLGQTGLVRGTDGGPLAAEPGLRVLYERRAWEEISPTSVAGFLCPLTGTRHAEVPGLVEVDGTPPSLEAPAPDAFADWAVSDSGPLATIDRSRIRSVEFQERTGGIGLPCEVVVYLDEQDATWWWEPYLSDEDRVAVELRDACRALGADDAALDVVRALDSDVPPDPPAESRARERVDSLDTVDTLAVKRYGTTGARQAIASRIASAKEEVIASFPWIKSGALSDDLLKAIKKALSRGASVYVAYGIAAREADEDSHPDAIAALRKLKATNTGESVHVAWVGHSHAKEILVDQAHYLGGSFNRFSFRGDPNHSGVVRRESMIYTNEADVVADARAAVVPDLQDALVRQASQAPPPKDAVAWLRRWRPILKLDWAPDVLRTALAGAPDGSAERQELLALVLRQLEKAKLSSDATLALLEVVPNGFLYASDPLASRKPPGEALQQAVERAEATLGCGLTGLRDATGLSTPL